MGTRTEMVRTDGFFEGVDPPAPVQNNVWLVGDDDDVIVIDASHDAAAIAAAIGERTVARIVITHGHRDHINAARELADLTGAPVAIHPADRMLWDETHPGSPPDLELADGEIMQAGGVSLRAIHAPGHTPGSVSFYDEQGGQVFTGDTLFEGGPGATSFRYGDFSVITPSIRDRLLVLPAETVVHTGHGPDTAIGTEAPHLDEWIARGH
jgi:glyoxylase-like metal-dependent hydrolase (beta-lactamase superfamily II)